MNSVDMMKQDDSPEWRVIRFVSLKCDQHGCKPGCTHQNHRRDVAYFMDQLEMTGLLDIFLAAKDEK
jgi:hypothetical protein